MKKPNTYSWSNKLWYNLLIVVLLVSSCKTKKEILIDHDIPQRSTREIEAAFVNHNFDYDWYACVTNIKVSNPDENISGKAYIRIKRDSIIWSSIKKLSAEGFRVLITEDSYVGLNRLDGTYQRGSTQEVFDQFNLAYSFTDVQDVIVGLVITDLEDRKVFKDNEEWFIAGEYSGNTISYKINPADLTISEVKIIDYRRQTVTIEYSDYKVIESGEQVPHYRKYRMPYDDRGDATITLEIKEIEVNIPKKTRFSIPRYYDKVD